MSLASHLKKTIEQARQSIASDEFHEVSFGHRQAIYASMGDQFPSIPRQDILGHKRRTWLAIMTARKVLPIWDRSGESKSFPDDVLRLAEFILYTRLEKNIFKDVATQIWGDMDAITTLNLENDNSNVYMAGFASVTALHVSIFDEEFDPYNIDVKLSIADFDPYDWDVANFACDSFSYLTYTHFDLEKKQTFWEWWLSEAVPSSFEKFG